MLLPDLKLSSRVNRVWKFSGIDHIDYCIDKNHFLSYPYSIDYRYNSRGFRDTEWPESIDALRNAIWCIGDSFTVGLGSPLAHTWPSRLALASNQRTINVSMDGASNDWISRIAQQVIKVIAPKRMVIMWSFTHRREHSNQLLSDEERRLSAPGRTADSDWKNLIDCKSKIDAIADTVQFAVPNFCHKYSDLSQCWASIAGPDWPKQPPMQLSELYALPQWILTEIRDVHNCLDLMQATLELKNTMANNQLKNVIPVQQQDLARDGFHFDLITADWVVAQAVPALKL